MPRQPRSPLPERLTAQALAGEPLRDPEAVAERLLAVQGQDPRGARLAVRARTVGVCAADVDRALSEERSLLITWLNRGTLHLVRSEDYPWLHALTAPPLLASSARRLRAEGLSPEDGERAAETIERLLAEEGPLTGTQLRERLDSVGVRSEGQALLNLLFLARWAGLPLRDARTGLAAIAPELVEREAASSTSRPARPPSPVPPPRLLGAFDPLLLGWTSREEVVGPHRVLVTMNGIFRPFALVGGRAVATWRLSGRKVTIEHLGRVTRRDAAALEADVERVLEFIGRP